MLPNAPEVIWNQFSRMIIAHACAAQVARSTAKNADSHNFFRNALQELSFGPTDSGRPFLIRDVGLRIAFQTRKLSNGPKNSKRHACNALAIRVSRDIGMNARMQDSLIIKFELSAS